MTIFVIISMCFCFTSCEAVLYGLLLGATMATTPTYTPPPPSYTPPPSPTSYTPPSTTFTPPSTPEFHYDPNWTAPPITPSTTTTTTNTPSTTTSTSSTSSSSSSRECPNCSVRGNGKCNTCNGKGYYTQMGIGSGTHKCPNCNGTGRCQWCGGTGRLSN